MGDEFTEKLYGNRRLAENAAERPRVTFALFAYNQENYVVEAVHSALAQQHSPLEIILSDDCSSDETFEFMEHAAQAYDGPHLIRLRRNLVNHGLGRHVWSVCHRALGELIVVAAGDDISLPERTHVIFQRWQAAQGAVLAFESACIEIDKAGHPGRVAVPSHAQPFPRHQDVFSGNSWLVGAAAAYDRRLFDEFPPLMSFVVNEDVVMLQRVFLSGSRCETIPQPLVKYRIGVGVSYESPEDKRAFLKMRATRSYHVYIQKLIDMQKHDKISDEIRILRRMNKILALRTLFHANMSLSAIFRSLRLFGFSATKSAITKYMKASRGN
jgi:glycosyltransferase involved in cell wall biosynthesis